MNSWQFRSLRICVRDIDKVAAYYRSLGIGTFRPKVPFDSRSVGDVKVNGRAADTTVKARTRVPWIRRAVWPGTE